MSWPRRYGLNSSADFGSAVTNRSFVRVSSKKTSLKPVLIPHKGTAKVVNPQLVPRDGANPSQWWLGVGCAAHRNGQRSRNALPALPSYQTVFGLRRGAENGNKV